MSRLVLVALLLACGVISGVQAQSIGRIVDAVDVTDRDTHFEINILFNCGLRYLSHEPASEGEELHLRLLPDRDCGITPSTALPTELPPVAADAEIIKSVRLEQLIAGELTLNVTFTHRAKFFVAPTADARGLRIRVFKSDTQPRASVSIIDVDKPAANYAINLESQTQPYSASALEEAGTVAGVPAYVSEYTLDGNTWYRLRIGPFATRADTEKVLNRARSTYPRAWLAIADDSTQSAATPVVEVAPLATQPRSSAPPLTAEQIATITKQARAAMSSKDYPAAIGLLTKLVEQQEYPGRADAQELLGLARERNGQLAHAKAEYEEFLQRYPQAHAADRVRQRLRTLATAHGRGFAGESASQTRKSPWRIYGGADVRYQWDNNRIRTTDTSTSFVSQNSAIVNLDWVGRRRGERFDFITRSSLGYLKDFLPNGPGNRTRVSTLFAEINDRELQWTARAGRQARNADGLLGTFDGLYVGYQLFARTRVGAVAGYPVESSYDSLQTRRRFTGLSFDFGTFAHAWDYSLYAVNQQFDGETDRRAIGSEIRYFVPGRTVIGLVDYDVSYHAVNSAILLGVFQLPRRWTLNFDFDRRKSPLLTTRNALIGQPATSLEQLAALFTQDEIRQLAIDRTADSHNYSIAVSRPLGERLQFTADVTSSNFSALPASGGVQALPDSGNILSYSLMMLGTGWFASSDFNIAALRYQTSQDAKIASAAFYSRFPFIGTWRLGPRLRVDHQTFTADDSTFWLYVPAVRLDYIDRRQYFEFEAGTEFGRRDLPQSQQQQKTTRYYFGVDYRWNF